MNGAGHIALSVASVAGKTVVAYVVVVMAIALDPEAVRMACALFAGGVQ